MQQIKGTPLAEGIAIGRIKVYRKSSREPLKTASKSPVEDTAAEVVRYTAARDTALAELERLRDQLLSEGGETEAALFDVYGMILREEGYHNRVLARIREDRLCAEEALTETGGYYAEKLKELPDPYLRERAGDIRDLTERVMRVLAGTKEELPELEEPAILVAEELTPSETVRLDGERLLGIAVERGTAVSHTAILARQRAIPAIGGLAAGTDWDGRLAILNGTEGTLTIDPGEAELSEARRLLEQRAAEAEQLREYRGQRSITRGGRALRLCANIGSVEEADAALEAGAEGIGLFRSEFLYLECDAYPSEEAQYEAYKAVMERMEGRPVIIRTADLGADKRAAYLNLPREENPALGYRAIRIGLDRPELLKTQLRAIYRASSYGKAAVMFPMIVSLEEVNQCRRYASEVKEELRREGIAYDEDMELGIMIETPAAALCSEALAREVDFLSIGTNDLTQYTLAADRQDARLASIYDPRHPAVLDLIRRTIEGGHRGGAWVGICGELAADPELTGELLRYGVDELSVAPSALLPLRRAIRRIEEAEGCGS